MEAPPDVTKSKNDATTDPLGVRALKDITFGSIAGMVSKVFEHPFDLTKVRLQSQVLDATARFNGPLDCLMQTWKNEGIRGLYRGLPAPIVGAMMENASLFWSYTEIQNIIRRISVIPATQDLSLAQLALAGSGAGAVTSFFLTPVELVKCKMQVQMLAAPVSITRGVSSAAAATSTLSGSSSAFSNLPGPISVLISTIRQTGFRGLWLGHTGTFIRELGGGAAWFASKEAAARFLVSYRRRHSSSDSKTGETEGLRPWESAVSGACAGVAYNVALFPADSVKSTMQTAAELRPGAERPTFLGTLRDMYRMQGIRGLYAGCGVTVARAVPSSAIIFLIYDGLSKRFSS